MPKSPQPPSIGRIVIFTAFTLIPGIGQDLPAIVMQPVEGSDSDQLDLHVFGVDHGKGNPYKFMVPYHPDKVPNTWRWPEIIKRQDPPPPVKLPQEATDRLPDDF